MRCFKETVLELECDKIEEPFNNALTRAVNLGKRKDDGEATNEYDFFTSLDAMAHDCPVLSVEAHLHS